MGFLLAGDGSEQLLATVAKELSVQDLKLRYREILRMMSHYQTKQGLTTTELRDIVLQGKVGDLRLMNLSYPIPEDAELSTSTVDKFLDWCSNNRTLRRLAEIDVVSSNPDRWLMTPQS